MPAFDPTSLVPVPVKQEIERMWDVMVAVSQQLSGSGPGEVTRTGYREIHLRLQLLLSGGPEMYMQQADHVAFRDWGEDIVAFGGDNSHGP